MSMIIGNTPVVPTIFPDITDAPDYMIPQAELDLGDYGFTAWVQPDQGNAFSDAPNLRIASRFGGLIAKAKGSEFSLGVDFTGGVDVITTPGGSPAGTEPLRLDGLTLGGSYTLVALIKFDAGATMSSTHTIFAAGLHGTSSSLKVFSLNSGLYVRHDAAEAVVSGVFAAGEEYLIMVSYDAGTQSVKAWVNSTTEVTWDANTITTGAGGDDDVTIASRWTDTKDKASQTLDGSTRFAMVGKGMAWVDDRFEEVRATFLQGVAALYPDITLS